jgi:Ca-activated chloride channel family protein
MQLRRQVSHFAEVSMQDVLFSRVLCLIHSFIQISFVIILLAFQSNICAQEDPDEIVRVRTDLVTVPVYVTDGQRRRVMDLKQSDFEVRDNGRVVKIDYFVAGTERVALVFLLDASGSTREVIRQQRDVALALLSRFGKGSEVAVIRFAETAKTVAPFSVDLTDASGAFELPALVNHRTAIFEAAASAVRVFDKRRSDVGERRIIVLISDGLDTMSTTQPREVIGAANERGISIYSIQIPLYTPVDGGLRPRSASKGFRDLAEKTGGRFFLGGDAKSALAAQATYDFSPIFRAIEDDLLGQYVLGYYRDTETQDCSFHRIDVKLISRDKRKLRVRSLREGYAATK